MLLQPLQANFPFKAVTFCGFQLYKKNSFFNIFVMIFCWSLIFLLELLLGGSAIIQKLRANYAVDRNNQVYFSCIALFHNVLWLNVRGEAPSDQTY